MKVHLHKLDIDEEAYTIKMGFITQNVEPTMAHVRVEFDLHYETKDNPRWALHGFEDRLRALEKLEG